MTNAAIVGVGRWGQILVNAAQECSHINFTRAVARTPDKVRDFADERGLTLTDNLEEALADPDLDAVVLATPHTQHSDQIMAAANAGKHVFCEKPFAMTAAEADASLKALADKGLVAAVGYNRRFSPSFCELKRMVDDGELGTVLQIEGNYSSPLPIKPEVWRAAEGESPAGGMTSLGVHIMDAMINVGGKVKDLTCFSRRLVMEVDVDDATGILMNFEDGPVGYLGTVSATPALTRLCVYGSKGWAEVRDHDNITYLLSDGTSDSKHWDGYEYPGAKTMTDEMEAFGHACEGGPPFPIPPDQIRHGAALLEAIISSAESGDRVAVK
jgi:predicted dehydrogenase